MSSSADSLPTEPTQPGYSSPNQIPIAYMSNQNLGKLSNRYEIRRDGDDRNYYVDHELESTSYQHPLLLEELKRQGIVGHSAIVVDTTRDGLEYLVDYNRPGVIGPVEKRYCGMYCGKRLEKDGREHKIMFLEGKIFGIFPSDDTLVEPESAAEEVQVEVVVFANARL